METGLTAIGTRYVFSSIAGTKIGIIFPRSDKKPRLIKKTRNPLFLGSMDGDWGEGERVRNFAEVRRKCMNASRESGSTCRYFHVDRVTGGRSSPVAFENFGRSEKRARPGFLRVRNADEPTTNERRTNDEWSNERMNARASERANERAKNSLSCAAKSVVRAVRILISAFLR